MRGRRRIREYLADAPDAGPSHWGWHRGPHSQAGVRAAWSRAAVAHARYAEAVGPPDAERRADVRCGFGAAT